MLEILKAEIIESKLQKWHFCISWKLQIRLNKSRFLVLAVHIHNLYCQVALVSEEKKST